MRQPGTPSDRPSVITVRDLHHRFGDHRALDGISFELPRGAVVGLLGRNGAGKTTLLRLLMGLVRRQQGEMSVLGHDPQDEPMAIKRRVGHVPETPGFYPWMRVDDLIGFVAHHRPEWDGAWAEELRRRFGIEPSRKVSTLSKGELALLALLLALGFRPPLLLLDEPAQGLDPIARERFFQGVLAGYGDDDGTVVLSTHLIGDVDALVDHVVMLDHGHVRYQGSTEALRDRVRAYRLSASQTAESTAEVFDPRRLSHLASCAVLRSESAGRQSRVVIEAAAEDFEEIEALLTRGGTLRAEREALDLEQTFVALAGPAP